ncbi:DUF2974 domain-containing protein [Parasalinivibrio latis]|uniref:lipase family protein n=1 Tax=Parasalinivibrio latis TaxID=2952610 RepID=UPI0030E3D46F
MKKLKRYQYERYAILCKASYPRLFDHTQFGFGHACRRDIRDRHGKTLIRVLWDDKSDVVVVFKGTHCFSDWLVNLFCFPKTLANIPGSPKVHWGFNYFLDQHSKKSRTGYLSRHSTLTTSYQADIFQSTDNPDPGSKSVYDMLLSTLVPLLNQGKQVSFTGHSSGGAMAVIAALKLHQQFPNAIKRIVTFGQPAAGFWSLKQHYNLNNRTYRICCGLDIVTFLPGLPLIYWHVGSQIWLHNERIYENTPAPLRLYWVLTSWIFKPFSYHFMDRYIRRKDYFDKH